MTVSIKMQGGLDWLIEAQLLNTVSNLGGTWPRYFVLRGIDAFTIATCHVRKESGEVLVQGMCHTLNVGLKVSLLIRPDVS